MPVQSQTAPNDAEFTLEVDCLTNGCPFAEEARNFFDFFRDLDERFEFFFTRTYVAADLFLKTLKLINNIKFEVDHVRQLLTDEVRLAAVLANNSNLYIDNYFQEFEQTKGSVLERTAEHYCHLFQNIDDYNYYIQPFLSMEQRIKKNHLENYFEEAEGKLALDAGCGSGRYTLALQQLGFSTVYGIDFSPDNIDYAEKMKAGKNLDNVFFFKADVLSIPFAEEYFDFVMSHGVLHHTPSMEQGLEEINRVLKPGGFSYIYVMEKPGGVLLDVVELLRVAMYPVPPEYARRLLRSFGLKEYIVYNILDHLLVPINTRTSPEELEAMLKKAGFSDFERLERGNTFDSNERIHLCEKKGRTKDLVWKYGVGKNAYIAVK